MAVKADCQLLAKKGANCSLIVLLSTISDEISRIDADVLSVNKTPIGAVILYSQDISICESTHRQIMELSNMKSM